MKVLIVEDDEEIAASIKKGLEFARYVVDCVHDGEIGLAYALSGEYDVIILDWMLPSVEGDAICRQLRAKRVRVAILILTARGELESRVMGLDVGADDYLVKPFAFDELLARLRAITRRSTLPPSMLLEVGPLRLDLVGRIATRDGTEIILTAREYTLLELLMRNPGRVFTRTELLARICDEDDEILATTIETYVSSLRSKIDKPFIAPHLIKTIWGQGYRLCP